LTASPPPTPATLSRRRLLLWTVALLATTLLVGIGCSLVGQYHLTAGVWKIRLFRATAAGVVGASLAIGGLALQALLRNPLAEPYVLGISSGAGVGVLLGIALGGRLFLPSWATTPFLAMIGAFVTSGVVYFVARRRGRLDPYVLILSGVIVNVINGALVLAILQFTRPEDMIHFIGWGMGQVPEWLWNKPRLLVTSGALVLAGWVVLFLRSAAYNTLGLGDEVAASSGVSVHWLRTETFLVVSIMTAMAVSLAGPVGFVGLIVPHVCRLVLGPDHRLLTIVSGFGGAMFLMVADTLCRMVDKWLHIGEVPVGVVTAVIGGPFFICLLRRRASGSGV
jgi:ABC-type Fe3+-siderophore transport system permease subunit